MRVLLVSPISPTTVGVGLAGRVRQWQESLSLLGDVTTIVIPVAGPPAHSDLVITPGPDSDDSLPRLARGLTEQWGSRFRVHAHDADVIVAVRSYLGLFAVGLAAATNAPVVVDLDDDDADYFRQRGDAGESARFEQLVNRLRERQVHLVSASGFAGTTRISNTVPKPDRRSRPNAAHPRGVIVGNFRYEPNAEGAHWFIQEVLPLVRKFSPDFELRLVGPGSQKFEPFGVGTVDDLADEYARSSVALCPILTGSGTRTKIIEAWMHEVPVVSTAIGAHGLDAVSGEHVLIGETPQELAEQIERVIIDHDLRRHLVVTARRLAEENFAPTVVATAVSDLVLPLVAGRTRTYTMSADLHLTETDEGLVVLDRSNDSVHTLNSTASMVLLLADGTLDQSQIAEEIRSILGLDEAPVNLVAESMQKLCETGLVSARIT